MKKSTLLLLISAAIFFTSTLVLLYLNYLKPTSTSTPTTGIIPTEEPTPTVDLTADWKTYNSPEFGFSIDYPQNLQVQDYLNDQYNRTVSFKGTDLYFSVTLRKADSNFNLDKYYFMDSPIARTTTLSGQKANIYEMPNGYCDGPGCSEPYIAIVTEHNGDVYSISFFGDSKLSSIESQILSTFKFISPTESASSDQQTLVKMLQNSIYPSAPEKVKIESTIQNNFASGTYRVILDSDSGPGGGWIAAKINNNWKLVEAFQEPPGCSLMSQYSVPVSIYGTCIDK